MPVTVHRLFMASKGHVNIQYKDFITKVFSLVRTKFPNGYKTWFRSLHSACTGSNTAFSAFPVTCEVFANRSHIADTADLQQVQYRNTAFGGF